MSAFDKVIGYDSIKNELLQVCDMIRNRELYTQIGAEMPRGFLLCGAPGLGKTLMCNAFIEESALPAFTVRKNKGGGDFISSITEAFEKAKDHAPSIVFLDDLDKFANEDSQHRDAEEYVAVQAGIDDVAKRGVFVIATVNDKSKLPPSLYRPGRFDRVIDVDLPSDEDAEKIISFYLSGKKLSPDVNTDDLSKMICYSSCAELETILNEAAIAAVFKRKEHVEMSDLVGAVLQMQYDSTDESYSVSDMECGKRVALHEAGHVVCLEALRPGSVGFASIRPALEEDGSGFVHQCKELSRRPHLILTALAGKAAEELYYADQAASGCFSDIKKAYYLVREGVVKNATAGFGMVDAGTLRHSETSESLNSRREAVIQALLEQYLMQARNILIQNRAFLELVADELWNKGILLHSDIQRIKASVTVTPVAA